MSSAFISIPRCSDRIIDSFFTALEKEAGFEPWRFRVCGSDELLTVASATDLLSQILANDQYAINEAYSTIPSKRHNKHITVTFHRGIYSKNSNGVTKNPSLRVDTIEISPDQLDSDVAIQVMSTIEREISSQAVPELPSGDGGSDLNVLVQTHHSLITSLRAQLAAIMGEFTTARLSFEAEMLDRGRKLASQFEDKKSELDSAYQVRVDELEQEREDLERRSRELDDRNNTHARRQLRQDLKDRLSSYKEKFELTQGTKKLRAPVTATVVLIEMACVLFLGLLLAGASQGADVWDKVALWIKSAGVAFFAIGTAVWYLKWLTQWSTRHADAEFQLRQLELDIDRASWVVETAFEWKSSQESVIPQSLLDAMSRNLFAAGDSRTDNADSPADHLASALLGDASKLKLKLGDQELELDRAAIKRAQKPR